MHQSGGQGNLTVDQHLEQEWTLFQRIEAGAAEHFCRIWEAEKPVVVVGRSTSVADHVVRAACHRDSVEILRRNSGGGAVVLGPGCLNYAFGFSLVSHPHWIDVADSFHAILGRLAAALGLPGLALAGQTDLALNKCKVSGNSQRRGRRALLHHGTLLYDFDAELAALYLREPARQPAYRGSRRHVEFMTNLPLSKAAMETRVMSAWSQLTAGKGASTAGSSHPDGRAASPRPGQ